MDTAGINFDLSPFVRKQMSRRPIERRSPWQCARGGLTDTDDLLCSVCGSADGTLQQFSCCGAPVHLECGGFCPRCDAAQSENEEIEECMLCRSDMMVDDRSSNSPLGLSCS